MSTAAAFRFRQPFPFCVTDISGGVGAGMSHVDNLTLAQVMQLGWNLETFTFIASGSATKGAATVSAGTLTNNPPGSSVYDRGGGAGMWLPTVSSNTAWASWPSAKAPRDRVCSSVAGQLCSFNGNLSSDSGATFFSVDFLVGTDPSNASKYRVYYAFVLAFHASSGADNVQIVFTDPNSSGGGTSWNSGTLTFGGLTLSWASEYTPGATPSGTGTLSATTADYTY